MRHLADLDKNEKKTVTTGGKEDEDPFKGDQSHAIDFGKDNEAEKTNHITIPSYGHG